MLTNLIQRLKKPKQITLGGETFRPEPLNLEQTIQLALLIAPYIPLIEEYWPRLRQALRQGRTRRPRLLSALVRAMAGEMKQTPGDMVAIAALLTGKSPQWMADHNVTAAEIITALPVLDEINDFYQVFVAVRQLGLMIKVEEDDA